MYTGSKIYNRKGGVGWRRNAKQYKHERSAYKMYNKLKKKQILSSID